MMNSLNLLFFLASGNLLFAGRLPSPRRAGPQNSNFSSAVGRITNNEGNSCNESIFAGSWSWIPASKRQDRPFLLCSRPQPLQRIRSLLYRQHELLVNSEAPVERRNSTQVHFVGFPSCRTVDTMCPVSNSLPKSWACRGRD
jgi:hypothetical protein